MSLILDADCTEPDAVLEKIVCIAPNCSLSDSQARVFLGSLTLATVLVSGTVALSGYWLVIPFAALELLAVFAALKISMRKGRYKEVIRISESQLIVEKGTQSIEERVEFPRYWATVTIRPAQVKSHPQSLFIGCKGRSLELGACLTDAERLGLKTRLTQLIGPAGSSPAIDWANKQQNL